MRDNVPCASKPWQGDCDERGTDAYAARPRPARADGALEIGQAAEIYGPRPPTAVIAHAVSQRTKEIGIRIAIGATARDILASVFGQAAVPVALGLAAGLAGSLVVNRLLTSALVGVGPADPLAMAAAALVLVAALALRCLVPARRALRIDPVIALRSE